MTARIAAALPILVAIIALGLASSCWPIALLLLLACLISIAADARLEVDRGRQLVVSLTGAIAGFALTSSLFEQERGGLTEGWTKLATTLLMAAIARLVLRSPAGGAPLNAALAFVAMVAIGQSHGHGYVGMSALFLTALVMALRSADGGQLASARWKGAIGVTLLAALLTAGVTSSLRVAYAIAMRRAKTSGIGWRAQKGFSDQIQLGAIDAMLDSDTLVLRVTGPRVDYLRGASFDEYEAGRWMRSERLKTDVEASLPTEPLTGEVVHIQAISDSTDRYFLPLEVAALSVSTPVAKMDGLGSIKRAGNRSTLRADVLLGPRRIAPLAPPGPLDLAMGRSTRHQISPLAEAWTVGASTTNEKLEAIERHLMREYRYATMVPEGITIDPAVDFLLRERKGHCELFATGMALLARASGIPARVVVGYRVSERSPIGTQWLVRERNAHAWVEAWVDGQWVRHDPTPELLVPQNLPHDASYGAAIADTLRLYYADLTAWFERRSLAETSLASLAGLIVLGIIVARGARSAKKLRPDDDAAPLPSLVSLLDALRAHGTTMLPGESIERFAARISDRESASALLAYAALRYGGIGDAALINVLLSTRTAEVRARSESHQNQP